jgi:hypothetical protein
MIQPIEKAHEYFERAGIAVRACHGAPVRLLTAR